MKIYSCFTILLITTAWFGCTKPKKQVKKNITFSIEKDTIDLGILTTYDTVSQTVKITNTGSDTLYISKITASCGCTVPKLTDTIIASGEFASVQVKYKPKDNDTGYFTKSVIFRTNCEEPFKLLRVIGEVQPK